MKKLLLSAALLLCMCIGMNAQPKILWDGPTGLDVKFKRCYVQGSRCIIDYTITNNTGKDISQISTDGWVGYEPTAYDDEGNRYKCELNGGDFDNQQSSIGYVCMKGCATPLPKDITIKAHIVITNLDEYASNLTLYKHYYHVEFSNGQILNQVKLEIRNIPIPRE